MVVDCSCYCQPFLGSQPGASPICRFDLPVNHQHIRFWYFFSSHLHYSRALGLRADQCIIWKRLAECSSFDPPQWVHSAHRVVMGDVCSGASNVCWLSPASRCYSKCIEAVQLIRRSDCVSVFQCRPKRSWLEDFVARWLTDVSPFAHAFAAMISSEFTGLETTVDATGSPMFVSVCICIQVLSVKSIYTCRFHVHGHCDTII